ncbi:MAG: glycosyltransferase family 4 protein [bacterium]
MATNLNIVFAADYIAPSGGAFIQSLKNLCKKIKEKNGKVAFLFSEPRPYLYEMEEYGVLYLCPGTANKRFSFSALINMQKAIRKIGANVVHIHFVGMAYLFSACLLKLFYRYKLIIHWRNPPISLLPGARIVHHLSPLFYRLLNFFFLDKNIVISKSIKELLLSQRFAPPKKIEVIYNGIDISKFTTTEKEAQNLIEQRIGKYIYNRPVIGMVANFSPQKDHETVIKAASMVKTKIPDIIFLFVGSEKRFVGEGRIERLKILADSFDVKENVIFFGEYQSVHKIIPRFDIGILCSNFEGFGNAIVEYMAAGKPVIGTKIGGIAEIIRDGEIGYLVSQNNAKELADKISILITDKQKAREMGYKARICAERNYSLEIWSNKMLDIYNNLL